MILLNDRAVLALSGAERFSFLQGLLTQDVSVLESGQSELLYAAMLNPQGKIRFDLFLHRQEERLLLDVAAHQLEEVRKTLSLYKLRAKVELTEAPELCVIASLVATPQLPEDPRLAAMGHRGIVAREALVGQALQPLETYHTHRIAFGVPDSTDFIADRAYVAEYGLEHLNGVSFTKGCYVGQEVVARMKHRTSVHKLLHQVESESGAPLPAIGTEITASGKVIGQLRSSIENQGLAILHREKLAQAEGALQAGEVKIITASLPEWFAS